MSLLHKCFYYLLPKLFLITIAFNGTASSLAPYLEAPSLSNSMSNTYSFTQLNWDKTLTLNGYKPSYTFYLPISKHLNPQQAVLHLKVAFSPLLTDSTKLDIRFNQTLIRSLTLPSDLSHEVAIDIELPLTQLSDNWQSLTFSAYFASTKSLCNPDIWIYISPESSLSLTSLAKPFAGQLNELPIPFINPATVDPVTTQLLLPKTAAPKEIFSLFQVAMQLGKLAADSKVNLSADYIDNLEKQKENNLIIIGTAEKLRPYTDLQLNALSENAEIKNALNKEAGILLLNQSPFNPLNALLTFTGKNYAGLDKAISAFLVPEFKALSSGKMAIINEVQINPATKTIGSWYQSSLKDMGYSTESVSGLGRHRLTYDISLPNDRIPSNASLKTFITSPMTNSEGSQITLVVNDQKQSTFWLTKEHSEWKTEIDTSAMKPGVNRLDYLIDLHLKDEQCSRQNYEEIWATIHAETEFKTSFFNHFPLATLNQLPVPFSNEVTVVLPDELSSEDINNLAKLFFKFGQLFKPTPILFNFLSSQDADEDFIRSHNIILIGTPSNNPWVKLALGYMPVQLSEDARILKLPQKQIEISGDHSTGLLELMPSPWREGNAVFLITGNNQKALALAMEALANDQNRTELNGNIALINSDKSIEVLNSYDNRYISLKNRISMHLSNFFRNIFYYLENHPQVFIYLLAILVPIIILSRQRRK